MKRCLERAVATGHVVFAVSRHPEIPSPRGGISANLDGVAEEALCKIPVGMFDIRPAIYRREHEWESKSRRDG